MENSHKGIKRVFTSDGFSVPLATHAALGEVIKQPEVYAPARLCAVSQRRDSEPGR